MTGAKRRLEIGVDAPTFTTEPTCGREGCGHVERAHREGVGCVGRTPEGICVCPSFVPRRGE